MNEKIFFSIIIPTYNRAGFIAKTILSVLNQHEQNLEIIVVDDGSTDNTEEIVGNIRNPKISYHKIGNSERGVARNFGASIAKGHYLNFLDSDDALYPHHLSTALKLIEKNHQPEFFHLGYDMKNEKEKLLVRVNNFNGDLRSKLIKEGNLFSCNGVFIRTDIFRLNPFNEDRRLSGSEDYELWLRLSAKYPVHYSNQVTSCIINHEDRSVLQMNKEKLITRFSILMQCVSRNENFISEFGKYQNIFAANGLSYISLHLALTGRNRGDAAIYLWKALLKNPAFVFKKRFLAIIKHLII